MNSARDTGVVTTSCVFLMEGGRKEEADGKRDGRICIGSSFVSEYDSGWRRVTIVELKNETVWKRHIVYGG